MNERVAKFGPVQDDELMEFLCECSAVDCIERVEMTLAEFEEQKKRGPLLAAGHSAHD